VPACRSAAPRFLCVAQGRCRELHTRVGGTHRHLLVSSPLSNSTHVRSSRKSSISLRSPLGRMTGITLNPLSFVCRLSAFSISSRNHPDGVFSPTNTAQVRARCKPLIICCCQGWPGIKIQRSNHTLSPASSMSLDPIASTAAASAWGWLRKTSKISVSGSDRKSNRLTSTHGVRLCRAGEDNRDSVNSSRSRSILS
jgi:hypothetical protein